MAAMTTIKCKACGAAHSVRSADVARGWGQFCSKHCKATHQTKRTGIAGPDYRAEGRTVHQMASGHYAKSKLPKAAKKTARHCWCGMPAVKGIVTNFINEDSPNGVEWVCDDHYDDTHPFSSDSLGQW